MNRPSNYNTKQNKAILDCVISLGGCDITAAQLVEYAEKQNIPIGRTTIYRNLEKLVQEGKLRKYNIDGISGACYRYVDDGEKSRRDLLLKCEGCGKFFHLHCEELNEIHNHIFLEHTFQVNTVKTVFYGKCETCFAAVKH